MGLVVVLTECTYRVSNIRMLAHLSARMINYIGGQHNMNLNMMEVAAILLVV